MRFDLSVQMLVKDLASQAYTGGVNYVAAMATCPVDNYGDRPGAALLCPCFKMAIVCHGMILTSCFR